MSQGQLQRIKVIEKLVEGHLRVGKAAELLNLSRRQVRRLKKRYSAKGVAWVYHGNRGSPPANRIAEEVRQQVVTLARSRYRGFNDSHLQEKLCQEEHLQLSRPSVRRILRQAGLLSPQKRRPPHYHSRRERREQEGAMLQVDGSREHWLEGRGPFLTLLGLVDDATSRVPVAHFQEENEDAVGYLRLFRRLVEEVGIPLSAYRDGHSVFQRNDEHWSLDEELQGQQFPTQVGRALEELGIVSIPAGSAQAKGRIERLWRTFQDRLRSELRLAGAATVQQANEVLQRFLVDYNQKFTRPPRQAASAYRQLDRRLDLDYIFSLRYERTVNRDHTITLSGQTVQLPALPARRGYAGKKVEVCQQPNGDLRIYLDRRLLHVQLAAPETIPVRALPMRRRSAPRKKKPMRIYRYGGRLARGFAA